MDLKLSCCTLLVHDLDEALAFYRDALGLDVHGHVDSLGTRRVSEDRTDILNAALRVLSPSP